MRTINKKGINVRMGSLGHFVPGCHIEIEIRGEKSDFFLERRSFLSPVSMSLIRSNGCDAKTEKHRFR